MPRTVEHIVACHRAADSLRRQGKPIWQATLDFTGVLPDGLEAMPSELDDAQAASLGRKYAQVIRTHPYVKRRKLLEMGADFDFELDDIVETLECIRSAEDHDMTAQEDLNNQLEALYDWADINRVWVTGVRG